AGGGLPSTSRSNQTSTRPNSLLRTTSTPTRRARYRTEIAHTDSVAPSNRQPCRSSMSNRSRTSPPHHDRDRAASLTGPGSPSGRERGQRDQARVKTGKRSVPAERDQRVEQRRRRGAPGRRDADRQEQ